MFGWCTLVLCSVRLQCICSLKQNEPNEHDLIRFLQILNINHCTLCWHLFCVHFFLLVPIVSNIKKPKENEWGKLSVEHPKWKIISNENRIVLCFEKSNKLSQVDWTHALSYHSSMVYIEEWMQMKATQIRINIWTGSLFIYHLFIQMLAVITSFRFLQFISQ